MLANGEGSWTPTTRGRSAKGFPGLYEGSSDGKGGRLAIVLLLERRLGKGRGGGDSTSDIDNEEKRN